MSNKNGDPEKNKKIKIFKNLHSRRVFLSHLLKTGIIAGLPFFNSCNIKSDPLKLSDLNADILLEVLKFLWPDDGEGPSVQGAGIYEFLLWIFSDPNYDPEEKDYLKKGLIWIDETSVEDQNLHFDKLGADTKKSLLEKISILDWGESWYSKIINIIFEALFADPVYGSNTGGISYKWLNHNPGAPRPDERNNYRALLEKKKENIEVTQLHQLK